MKVSELSESRFLKKEDFERPALCTIRGLAQENVSRRGDAEELQWCLYFEELEKPMVLKPTNAKLIQQALGSDDTDHWVGQKIVLYNEPSVQDLKGKLVGGIRVRAPRNQQPAPTGRPGPATAQSFAQQRPAGPAPAQTQASQRGPAPARAAAPMPAPAPAQQPDPYDAQPEAPVDDGSDVPF